MLGSERRELENRWRVDERMLTFAGKRASQTKGLYVIQGQRSGGVWPVFGICQVN